MQNFLFCFFCQASSASFFRPRRSLSRPRSRSLGSLIPSFYAPSSGDSSESPPAPTVTLSDQSPPPERACFSTLAVAHRRLGPTSSASISTVDLVSPSGVGHVLGQRPPRVRPEVRGLPVLPLPGGVLVPSVDGDPKVRHRSPVRGVPKLRVVHEIPHDDDLIPISHLHHHPLHSVLRPMARRQEGKSF